MMSADPEIPNRKVWTGRHYSVPVDPAELVKLFMDQVMKSFLTWGCYLSNLGTITRKGKIFGSNIEHNRRCFE